MKKRIIIVGSQGVGKTSIANILNKLDKESRRCPDVIYGKHTIDVPSAYIENSWMYKHLIALAQDAYSMIIVVSTKKSMDIYSHGFARVFNIPIVGVINNDSEDNETQAIKTLKLIGVEEPYFRVNAKTAEGVEKIREYLKIDERGN
ncbi:MAG: EutP/PduV family microcompartment system protein [Filifactoraceae bacterium]